ncbi:MAG: ABC transporter permease [Chloroflexi bacterium]|nr:ABC transporter permease [Chloroflexota bacterium]MBU1750092.1 ABC transporter permease [Chloroflexota bacterium]
MFPRTLLNVAWRTLLRRPWQTGLMILGITLGVAVVVAVDLANASAGRAFDLSAEAIVGRATHEMVAGPEGLDEALYVRLRLAGALPVAAPIITEYVSSPQLGDRPLQLLGVDPFSEPPFRDHLWRDQDAASADAASADDAGLTDFLTEPGALFIAADVADRYGLARGDRLTLDVGGFERDAYIAGVLRPTDDLSRRALDGVILADIATAQELLDRVGRLDRVDLILPDDGGASADRIRALLPTGVRVEPVSARAGAIKQMTAAFQTNLVALSLLALFVGLFLIYNTMTFSVVQRRPLFGTLRCLGVTPGEVFALVVSEALVVGVVGSGLGLLLGIVMGQNAVDMVTQTVNDLYFVLTVRSVGIPPESLVKGAIMGIVATIAAAGLPAWEAASVPPRAALSRSGLETKARRAVVWAALGSVITFAAGVAVLALPTRDLWISFGSLAAVVLGFGLLTPLATIVVMRAAAALLGRVWGARGRMAPRDVVNSLSRTSIAVAALMIAVSVTIGVSLMIGSFRGTVVTWLGYALQGDVYVWAPSFKATQNTSVLAPAVVGVVEQTPGVARADLIRATDVDSPAGPVYVEAGNSTTYGEALVYKSADGSPAEAWGRVRDDGAVIVSEPLAVRLGLPASGGTLTLYTDRGPRTFAVAGIYYDYASSEGTAIMLLDVYRSLWDDDAVTGVAIKLTPGADADAVALDLEERLAPVQRVLIWPNQALRRDALAVFDRTFAITGALQMLATVVAFIGVLSALLSLQLDKRRQLGILRAVGLTVRELWGLVLLETGLMGAVAGLLALPAGYVLALILVYIINQRSFGWTLQMQVTPGPFVEALAVAITAALLAGIYPAYRMGRLLAAEALRYE